MSQLLSIVIPTWNRAGLVCEAIDSVVGQSEAHVKVILVDDGSTDGMTDLLSRRYDSRIVLLTLPQCGGVGAARNPGVRMASGERIAFLDSDDLWLPGKLAAEMCVLERFPEADAIVSDSQIFIEGVPNARIKMHHTARANVHHLI